MTQFATGEVAQHAADELEQPPAAVLEVEGLRASYGSYRALFGISFKVPAGGVVALLGPNGAGKSTVARVISGLVQPTGGSVRLNGRDVTGAAAWRIARAGLVHVPEGRAVFATLSVEENLVLAFRRLERRGDVRATISRVYESFPLLAERRRERAGTLSGGQQRLLSLAKVLAVPPKLLVADELSLGLAPGVVDDIYEKLIALQQAGAALLVVEQQIDRALMLASHAVVLDHGKVAYDGPSQGAVEVIDRVYAARVAIKAATAPGAQKSPQRRARRIRRLARPKEPPAT